MTFRPTPLVLASASPRRADLLKQIGVKFTTRPADVDEQVWPGEAPADYVLRLAVSKARAVGATGAAVLGADTTVAVDGECLGKARDQQEAVSMLMRLQDRWHEVHTGVAVLQNGDCERFVTCTRVKFGPLGHAHAMAYWQTGEPHDKAGAYAIQGLGALFIERIEGSYSGVVGLPLAPTALALARAGVATALTNAAGDRA
ncbi:MAG: Maf family protein [Pseudomonadota bacterium]